MPAFYPNPYPRALSTLNVYSGGAYVNAAQEFRVNNASGETPATAIKVVAVAKIGRGIRLLIMSQPAQVTPP